MKLNTFFKIKTISTLLFVTVFFAGQSQEKPSFILILSDDLGYNDVGFTGFKKIYTHSCGKTNYKDINGCRLCQPIYIILSH